MTVRSATVDVPLIRTFTLRAETVNNEQRSVDAVIATEAMTTVFDMMTWEPVDEVLLMDGCQLEEQVVLVDSHPQARNGSIISADVHGSVRNLRIERKQLVGTLYFADDPASLALWGKVRDKHLRDLSVGAQPIERVEIPPRGSAEVNGKTYRAKDRRLYVTARWWPGEVSVTPRGADSKAKIRQAVDAGQFSIRENSMNETLRHFLEDNGMAKGVSEETALNYLGSLTGTVRAEADRLLAAATAPDAGTVRAAAPAPTQPAVVPSAQPVVATNGGGVQVDAETIRSQAAAGERARVNRIYELAGSDIPQETVRQAINEGWDENRASQTFLNTIRAARTAPAGAGSGPAIHSRSHEGDCTLRALQVGLMHRVGARIIDPRASETVRAQQERDAELGHRYRDTSMFDMCRESLRLSHRNVPHGREETIHAAVSGATLSNIFSTSINANLMQAFEEAPDTTQGVTVDVDVSNFQTQERASMGKSATPKRLPPGGTAEHATISDAVESYKISRFASQLVIDEQDFINDNLGGMQRWVQEMGMACARLRPDLFYSILLANAAMRDGVALFATGHSNYVTGAGNVLSVTSLAAGVTAMTKQTEDGVNLNLSPVFLLVPQDLRFTAQQILRSAEVRDTTASTKYPVYNAMQDLNLVVRADNRLGVAGVTDPVTGTARAGLATNWILAAEGARGKTMECGYLAGTGRKPSVRPFTLDRGQWGLGWDIKMDIGMKPLDWRGWYMSTGA